MLELLTAQDAPSPDRAWDEDSPKPFPAAVLLFQNPVLDATAKRHELLLNR